MLIKNRSLGCDYYMTDVFGKRAEFSTDKKKAMSGNKKALKKVIEKIHNGEYSTLVTDDWGGYSLLRYNTRLVDNAGRDYLEED